MTKDNLIMSLRIIVSLTLIFYITYLYISKVDIIPTKNWIYDTIVYIIVWILSLIVLFIWITKFCIKKPRITQIIMWIFIIIFANYVWLQDNISSYIFLKDILNIIWTIMIILWFTKICIYNKCEKKEQEKEMEIIEV